VEVENLVGVNKYNLNFYSPHLEYPSGGSSVGGGRRPMEEEEAL